MTSAESLRWIGLAAAQFARWNRIEERTLRPDRRPASAAGVISSRWPSIFQPPVDVLPPIDDPKLVKGRL